MEPVRNHVVEVQTETEKYPIYIDKSFEALPSAFEAAGLCGRKLCLITDSNVAPLYADAFLRVVQGFSVQTECFVFSAGEENKNLETIQKIYAFMLEKRMDRKSVVVALGGGVTGDMAGFAAATYMRGVPYVQIPTTLLSQVDSSVGGKTGVDFMGNKNMVGAFYQPRFVYINSDVLRTLPAEQFASGMAEAIKHGFIQDPEYLRFFASRMDLVKALDSGAMAELIAGSCRIKAGVVSKDEKEQGLREILNFGHTFGHAVESLSGYRLPHGHCVALGMAAALWIGRNRGVMGTDVYDRSLALLRDYGLPVSIRDFSGVFMADFNAEDVFAQMKLDKKSRNGRLNLVLLRKIGDAYTADDVGEAEVLDAIGSIMR